MSDELDNDKFQRLLTSMPDIAEAVNKFSSEENQHTALRALIESLVAGTVASVLAPASPNRPFPEDDPAIPTSLAALAVGATAAPSASTPVRAKRSTRKPTKSRTEPIRDLDFWPNDKLSLREFVEEKQPSTIAEKNIVAVHYLEQVLQVQGITTAHVLAVYSECDWKEPTYPDNALQVTASRERWVDTKDMQNIVTTPSGRNKIREMPVLKKSKK